MSNLIEEYECTNLRKDYYKALIQVWDAGGIFIADLYVHIRDTDIHRLSNYPERFVSKDKQKVLNSAKYHFNRTCQSRRWGKEYKPSKWKLL